VRRAEIFSRWRLRKLPAAWWVPVSIALGIVTWPFGSIQATAGLDRSWQIALHLAASRGLDFGHDLVFTYGPLGFLLQPVLVGGSTGTASVLVTFAAHVAFCALLLRGALRSVSPPLAIVIVYAITGVLAGAGFPLIVPDYLVFFVLFLAVWILEREDPAPSAFIVLGAIAAAAQLLVKINGGVLCILMLAVVAWRCRPGGARSLALLAVSYMGAVATLWLLTGNSLAELPTWFRLSFHIVTAYAGSMGLEVPGRSREYIEAVLAVLCAGAAVILRTRTLDRARAFSIGALVLVYGFGYWKEGFIRHDVHALAFFAAIATALLAFRWSGVAGIAAAGALVVAVAASVTAPEFAGFPFHPHGAAAAAAAALQDSVIPHRRDATIAAGRAAIEASVSLDSDVLAELRGHTVDVEPYETSAVWAYGLQWRPALLLQQYVAGDAELDSADAGALARRGAARVLRQELWPALDGKHPLYEAPSTFMVLVCRYRELSSNGTWAVFARGVNRCGTPRLLSSTSTSGGTTLPVPSPPAARDIVFARIRVRQSIAQRVEGLLLKARHQPTITVDDEQYRLVPATATGPLILRMPAAAGISAAIGGAVDYSRVAVSAAPSYRIDFYAVSLTKSSRGPAGLRGTLTADTVTAGKERARIVRGAVAGRVEQVVAHGGAAAVAGWAADVGAGVPAEKVLVFSHGRLLGWAHPATGRSDVAALYKNPGVTYSGFSVSVAAADAGALTVVAISRGRASVLAGSG
jgi:hypothetical protein